MNPIPPNRAGFPTVTDFERGFASLCFALATGVGKPWEYALIFHDKIAQNMTIEGLVVLKVQ